VYRQRFIVIGRGLNRHIEPRPGMIASFDVEAKEAWEFLQYYPTWLDLPYDIGAHVIKWNQEFRSRSFED